MQQTVRRRSMAVVRAEYGDETHWGVPEDSYLVLVRSPLLVSVVTCTKALPLPARHGF